MGTYDRHCPAMEEVLVLPTASPTKSPPAAPTSLPAESPAASPSSAPMCDHIATSTSCTASSEYDARHGCENTYDGQMSGQGSRNDAGKAWATKGEGEGSWIKLNFDRLTTINTMEYYNRDAFRNNEANTDVSLLFSDGSTQIVNGISQNDSSTHMFSAVSTTSVKITVTGVHGTVNNGAEEIIFSYTCLKI